MSMLRRFFSYYKPYKFLFWLDMGVAILSSVLAIFFPALTRELLRTWIPNQIWRSMVICFIAMFAIYALQACFTYIRIRWGHQLGVYVENDMRKDLFSHLQKQCQKVRHLFCRAFSKYAATRPLRPRLYGRLQRKMPRSQRSRDPL